jgi:FkbM family methyltransferase
MTERQKGFLRRTSKRLIRSACRRLGYDLVPFSKSRRNYRSFWIDRCGINTVVDVGANVGQFAELIKKTGFDGKIISIEPQKEAFDQLSHKFQACGRWRGINCALGAHDGELELEIAGNSVSSSLLPMLPSHIAALAESAPIGKERVAVHRLDDILPEHLDAGANIYLKIDAQGYELPVINGATAIVDRVSLLELELSLVPLYEGQDLMPEVCLELRRKNFEAVHIEQGFSDLDGMRILQVDGLFIRSDPVRRIDGACS